MYLYVLEEGGWSTGSYYKILNIYIFFAFGTTGYLESKDSTDESIKK